MDPWGGYDTPYAVPNLLAEWTPVESPIRTGAWRAVEYPANVFARESFLDEIAHRAGQRSARTAARAARRDAFPWASGQL